MNIKTTQALQGLSREIIDSFLIQKQSDGTDNASYTLTLNADQIHLSKDLVALLPSFSSQY